MKRCPSEFGFELAQCHIATCMPVVISFDHVRTLMMRSVFTAYRSVCMGTKKRGESPGTRLHSDTVMSAHAHTHSRVVVDCQWHKDVDH